MFAEFPKIFGHNFAIGYYLPVVVYLCLALGLLQILGIGDYLTGFFEQGLLIGTTVIGLISWVGGILLMSLNRDIIRFLEGYGKFNPLVIFKRFEIEKCRKLETQIADLEQIYDEEKELTPEQTDQYNTLCRNRIRRFPDNEKFILPTPFGNIIRAFEVYSRLMYGIDSIVGWSRLWSVIPADYRGYIENAKTYMDFWVNINILNVFFGLEVMVLILYSFFWKQELSQILLLLALILFLVIGAVCYYRSLRSAIQWGDTVKSAFDLFLPDLAKKLCFELPNEHDKEKQLWENYGIAIDFARDDYLPQRNLEQAKEQPNKNDE